MANEPDLGSSERRFGTSFFGKPQADITENRDFLEQARLAEALRDAKPEFLKDGNGIRGPVGRILRTEDEKRRTDFGRGSIARQPRQPIFPEDERVQSTQVAGVSIPNIAFILSDASTTAGGVTTRKVKVFDGKIQGVFPSGMGFNNYVLTITTPSDALIYVGATFDPRTLTLNSRFLAVSKAADFPESRVESDTAGFLYWLIGFTYLDANGKFKIVNTRVGNIDFQIVYGSQNGQPALLPVDSQPGWLDLAFGP